MTLRTVILSESKYVLNGVLGEAYKWRRNVLYGPKGPIPDSMPWEALMQVFDSTHNSSGGCGTDCTRASLVMSRQKDWLSGFAACTPLTLLPCRRTTY